MIGVEAIWTARGARRLARWRPAPFAVDLAICVVLSLYAISATTDPTFNPSDTVIDTLLLPTVAIPVLLRRRASLAAAWAFAAGCVVSGIPTFDQIRIPVAIPAALIIVYSLACRVDRSKAVAGFAIVLAGLVFVGATDSAVADSGGVLAAVSFSAALCGVVWAAGRVVWSRERVAAELRESSERLVRQRERSAAVAIELERTRLAAHLDLAATAPLRAMIDLTELDDAVPAGDLEAERRVFARIEDLGRGALNDMRGLLGVLRSDGRDVGSPPPSLAQIESLLAEARARGRRVEFEVEGKRRELGVGAELAAYRTLQHALSAVGDTGERPATVTLRYAPEALEIEVGGLSGDRGAAEAALLAARERVVAQGGRFRSEPGETPGRRVMWARLPAGVAGG